MVGKKWGREEEGGLPAFFFSGKKKVYKGKKNVFSEKQEKKKQKLCSVVAEKMCPKW